METLADAMPEKAAIPRSTDGMVDIQSLLRLLAEQVVNAIMDEYDLGKSTVERWIKSINATGSPRAADNRTPEQNRILELERENRRLRMEVDVLKRAALIYARK